MTAGSTPTAEKLLHINTNNQRTTENLESISFLYFSSRSTEKWALPWSINCPHTWPLPPNWNDIDVLFILFFWCLGGHYEKETKAHLKTPRMGSFFSRATLRFMSSTAAAPSLTCDEFPVTKYEDVPPPWGRIFYYLSKRTEKSKGTSDTDIASKLLFRKVLYVLATLLKKGKWSKYQQ